MSLTDRLQHQAGAMKRWLRLVGVGFFLIALPYAATGYGLAVAWVPVWLGVLLFQAASAAGDETGADMIGLLRKLRHFFIVLGILLVVLLIGSLLLALMSTTRFAGFLESQGF